MQRSDWCVSLFSLDVCMEVFVAGGRYLFTSESVSSGHPDKMADQISDGVLDALLREHPKSRVACETLVTTGLALLSGEITSDAKDVDYVNLTIRAPLWHAVKVYTHQQAAQRSPVESSLSFGIVSRGGDLPS